MIFLTEIGNTIRKASSQYWDTISITLAVSGGIGFGTFTGRYSSDGYYYFYGVEEVLRAYMDKNNLTLLSITGYYTEVDSDSSQSATEQLSQTVIMYRTVYMRAHPTFSANTFPFYHFITPRKSIVLFAGADYHLTYYNVSSNVSYTITYTKRDGTTTTSTGTAATSGLSTLFFGYNSNYAKAHVVMGDRTFDIFYIDTPATEKFKYRNAFNVEEWISLPASTTSSPKTEYEEARQGQVNIRYDIENDTEFTVKTGPLPASLRPSLLALCKSRLVKRGESYTSGTTTYTMDQEVIITDYKLDKSDNPNDKFEVEIKMKYADMRSNDAVVIE